MRVEHATVALPVEPPVAPMLATLARELPHGPFTYEPKWDGFRCLVFRDGAEVDLRSRKQSPLARYFPELVDAFRALDEERLVLDGEIVVTRDDVLDFDALLKRIHPAASHVERLAHETPATFVAFDVLAVGDEDLRSAPFGSRRARLEHLLGNPPNRISLTPATADASEASRWLARSVSGVDGVVAKRDDSPYLAGKRAMIKVKHLRTVDCVVAGFRMFEDRPAVASLLLGLYAGPGLVQIGVIGSFPEARRRALLADLEPHRTSLDAHPWRDGFGLEGGSMGRLPGSASRWTPDMTLDWVPLRPELVCEASYDHAEGLRWRHPGRFVRWRPDRHARSCTIDQLAADA